MKKIWNLFTSVKYTSKYYITETTKYHPYIDKYSSTFTVYESTGLGFDTIIDQNLVTLDDAKQTLAKYKERLEKVGEKIIKDV